MGGIVALVLALPTALLAATQQWGSFLTPFAADSLWNARPVKPVFGDAVIPKSSYFPAVATGAYSTGVFLSQVTDGAVVVHGPVGKQGVWDPDAEVIRPEITIPHWPSTVAAATGSDGHADIVDPTTGIIHSFWQLVKQQDGQWTATQYAWARINGSGWGDPAHYFQGARAAGVPTAAGLVRKHEVNDGQTTYRHALAMSLTFNGLRPNPSYIFPATSADNNAASTNTGEIPIGARLMLPPTYNTAEIANPALRKIAETLKLYGAYVVDRNEGTPYVIYVENGSDFNLHKGGWNNAVASELDRIRSNLRQVVSAQGWVDGNDKPFTPNKSPNILSLRGPWKGVNGPAPGVFNTWEQAVVFPATTNRIEQFNDTMRGLNEVQWAKPQSGDAYQLAISSTGGAKLRMQIRNKAGEWLYDSGELENGQKATFDWPQTNALVVLRAISGVGGVSSVKAELVKGVAQ
jgi:hypothetical protein